MGRGTSSVLLSGTGAGDERLVGRDEKQRNRTRGEARGLSLTFHTVAKKASRQLCTSMGTILVPEAILVRQDQQYPTNKDRQKLIPYYGFLGQLFTRCNLTLYNSSIP